MSVYLYVCMSVCLDVCLSGCLSVWAIGCSFFRPLIGPEITWSLPGLSLVLPGLDMYMSTLKTSLPAFFTVYWPLHAWQNETFHHQVQICQLLFCFYLGLHTCSNNYVYYDIRCHVVDTSPLSQTQKKAALPTLSAQLFSQSVWYEAEMRCLIRIGWIFLLAFLCWSFIMG